MIRKPVLKAWCIPEIVKYSELQIHGNKAGMLKCRKANWNQIINNKELASIGL